MYRHGSAEPRYGAGLTEPDVRRFQVILGEHCRTDVGLPEAWSRAIEVLSLIEILVDTHGALAPSSEESTEFALPRT